jgi:hypothetical protein
MSLLLAALTARHLPINLPTQARSLSALSSSRHRQARSLSALPSSHLPSQLPRHAQSLSLICLSFAWISACAAVVASPSGRSTRAQVIGGAHVHVSE